MRPKQILFLTGQVILAGIFIYAGYAKIREPWAQFATSLYSFKLLPDSALEPVARTLPWCELTLGIAILSGILLRWSALIASLLLALFFGVLIRSYAMGLEVDCGCFGAGETNLGPLRLTEEAAMLALAVAVTVAAFRGYGFKSRKLENNA
ncbi:MAG: DoxX family membrane protein [Acidobacteriota bacterium]|nr:DoxX family membrane protein [Acidobacteriota bacterium]